MARVTSCSMRLMCRGALQTAEEKAAGCEAQQSRLQFRLAEAQAEVSDSRSHLAVISDSHCAELAARAHAAAQQESVLASERAANAKLSAQVLELQGSQSLLQVCTCQSVGSCCVFADTPATNVHSQEIGRLQMPSCSPCTSRPLSLVIMQERLTTVDGERGRTEAELALTNCALAACKRQLSSAWAENVSLVGAFEQPMQGHAELTCTAPPD